MLGMKLAPPAKSAPFTPTYSFGNQPATGPAPTVRVLDAAERPADSAGLVSVRYDVFQHGTSMQFTTRNDDRPSEPWFEVRGTIQDAARAARDLAIVDEHADDPAAGTLARTSVAVLNAGDGVWHLARMAYLFPNADGSDKTIYMPIDRFPGKLSTVAVPFSVTPERITVRFDDPRVTAVVGRDSYAVAPR